jgi:cell division inhibitor SepF
MSAMRKIGEYLGLLEDTGRYDDDLDDAGYDSDYDRAAQAQAERRHPDRQSERRPAPVSDLAERRSTRPAEDVVAELSRITTVHPRTYNEARTVGEQYRDGTPVIMNLSDMDDNDAKRLVDFAAGLVFATRGTIERITNKVFLLSPPNVSVAAEDKQLIAEGGFFNQS